MKKIKPCPFCGGSASCMTTRPFDSAVGINSVHFISCISCEARGSEELDWTDSKYDRQEAQRKALKSWNERVCDNDEMQELIIECQKLRANLEFFMTETQGLMEKLGFKNRK